MSREDFLAGELDLMALFSLSLESLYSDDFVQLLGADETNETHVVRDLADVLDGPAIRWRTIRAWRSGMVIA